MAPTLIGVLIGAAAALASITLQLWFNSRQRERDRYMQLRRDVYFEAAEGLAGMLEFLQQNTRTDVPLGKAERSLVRQGWLFKTYLIGRTDTLLAMNEANASVVAATLEVFSYRLAVSDIDDEITLTRTELTSIDRLEEELRTTAKAIDLTTPSEVSLRRFEFLKAQLGDCSQRRQHEIHKLETLTNEHAKRIRALIVKSMEVSVPTQKAIRAALLAARAELQVSIDATKFGVSTAGIDARVQAKLEQLIQLIQIEPEKPEPTA